VKVNFHKYVTEANGDVYYAVANSPKMKTIDGVVFIEVTNDFKRAFFIRMDSLRKVGRETHNVP
jgi:hypothetical protein